MSLKKTWFSYVLWFVFALLTMLITYSVLGEVLREFYAMLGSYAPEYAIYIDFGAKILTVLVIVFAVILVHNACGRIKKHDFLKWSGIAFHILMGVGIVAGFCALRYQTFVHAYFLQAYSSAPSMQAQCFYELSKIGSVTQDGLAVGTVSILEQGYISFLKALFLFLGNKIEILYFVQPVLQGLSLVLLMVIGWTIQKGIFAWIPALLYAISPTFIYSADDVGISNFWTFLVVLGLYIICLLEKVWKKKNITYLVMVFAQSVFGAFVFYTKADVLLSVKAPFISGGITPGAINILDIEMFLLTIFFVVYCVSFFMDKQDHRSLFILPFATFIFGAVWLSNYEFEISYCMMLMAMLNFSFMFSQSLRVIFKTKAEVVTGQDIAHEVNKMSEKHKAVSEESTFTPADFEWSEMKEVMHSTEGVGVSVDKTKEIDLAIEEVIDERFAVKEEVVIDRTAPIENVLPMPKKHKPRVLDYAFEPSNDMMHYDVEIENDEYDY